MIFLASPKLVRVNLLSIVCNEVLGVKNPTPH